MTLCKGGKFPLMMTEEMPQCCLIAIDRSQTASALGPPLGSRAGLGDGPNTGLSCPVLMLMGLVPVQFYLRHQLMLCLCRLPVDLLMAVGLCPTHYALKLLSTNV